MTGYTTPGGNFCFRFGPLTGGCVHPGELNASNPVAYTVDYGPKTFRVYGLAIDGVTSVSLRARGVTRRVLLVRNAVYIDDASLGGSGRFTGTLIVHLRGGAGRAHADPRVRWPAADRQVPPDLARRHAGRGHGGLTAAVRGPVRRSGGAGPGASYPGGASLSS